MDINELKRGIKQIDSSIYYSNIVKYINSRIEEIEENKDEIPFRCENYEHFLENKYNCLVTKNFKEEVLFQITEVNFSKHIFKIFSKRTNTSPFCYAGHLFSLSVDIKIKVFSDNNIFIIPIDIHTPENKKYELAESYTKMGEKIFQKIILLGETQYLNEFCFNKDLFMDALSSRYLAISKFLDFYLYNLYSLLKGSIQVNSEKEKIARNLGSEVIFTKNTKFLFGDNKDKPIPAEIQGIAHSNLYDKKESPNPCILFKSNYLKLILDSIKINYLRFILNIFKLSKSNRFTKIKLFIKKIKLNCRLY
jgi:hypothetical protein